jgi:hypothetical protein
MNAKPPTATTTTVAAIVATIPRLVLGSPTRATALNPSARLPPEMGSGANAAPAS